MGKQKLQTTKYKFNEIITDFESPVSALDALKISLIKFGKVDIGFISNLCKMDVYDVITELKGYVCVNPKKFAEGIDDRYEMCQLYYSGDISEKLEVAESVSAMYDGAFDEQIRKLKKLLPPKPSVEDIYVTLGTSWIPTKMIEDFISYLFRSTLQQGKKDLCRVEYLESIGKWVLTPQDKLSDSVMCTRIYGTKRCDMFKIITKTLNHDIIKVYDYVDYGDGKQKRAVISEAETALATEKQKVLVNEFETWVKTDSNRAEEIRDIFYKRFSSYVPPKFAFNFLDFDAICPEVNLYEYQKNAVERIFLTGKTLLAHDVGTGKTFIMVVAGMAMRRTGISRKNLFVVPNNIISQWKEAFEMLYPGSNVLTIQPYEFTPSKRDSVLVKIRDNDYDGIIMGYGSFDLIESDYDTHISLIERRVREIDRELLAVGRAAEDRAVNELLKERGKLQSEIQELSIEEAEKPADRIRFKDLGINTLFVDEAHNFKNLPIDTNMTNLKGINSIGSVKCRNMLIKCNTVLTMNGGRGVVMATGTPVTNSVTDIFSLQTYLSSDVLRKKKVDMFDKWAGTFGKVVTEYEISLDSGSYQLSSRFAKFNNLPELSALINGFTDFHYASNTGLPTLNGYDDVLIKKSAEQNKFIEELGERVDNIKNKLVSKKEDNLLYVTTDGRKIALDVRLYDGSVNITEKTKTEICADKVYEIYKQSQDKTQLVFSDIGTPKDSFNVYDELKRVLVEKGVPKSKISFAHDATTEVQRAKLFENVKKGKVRILIGSTFKLGTGVNVQDRLIAIHHLDVPWRPSDMVQREGRILRQGNMNDRVHIFRYITEGSFDAYSWQLLESKQRFISQLLSGSITARSGNEVDSVTLSYAEVKALAIGNPLIKDRVKLFNEITVLRLLYGEELKRKEEFTSDLQHLPELVDELTARAESIEDDVLAINSAIKLSKEEKTAVQKAIVKQVSKRGFYNFEYMGLKMSVKVEKGSVYLNARRNEEYAMDILNYETGVMTKADKLIKEICEKPARIRDNIEKIKERIEECKVAAATDGGYAKQIEEKSALLEKYDIELGIK